MTRLRRSGPLSALCAAVGASYFVTGATLVLRELALPSARELELAITHRTLYFGGLSEPILMTIALTCGTIAAGAAARRAGGRAAVALYASVIALTGVLLVAHAFEAERRVRAEPGFYVVTLYDMPLTAAATLVLPALGLALGALLARSRAVDEGCNAILEASGAYAVVGAIGVVARLPTYPQLLFAPFETVGLETMQHLAVVAAQIAIASLVFVVRGRPASVSRAAAALVAMGLAGVAYAEVAQLYGVVFYHHTYVPVSLVVVPLASAVVGITLVLVGRSQFRSRAALL